MEARGGETGAAAGDAVAPSEPARPLSVVAAAGLVVANMIGTGIFTTSGLLAGQLGGAWMVLAAWAIAGVFALSGASVYAELGAMMPRVGGEYVYLSRAFHPLAGFLSGWVSLLVGFSAPIAASAVALGAYLHAVFPSIPPMASALTLIVTLSALHMVDIVWGARVQVALTIAKVAVLVGLAVGGLAFGSGHWGNMAPAASAPAPTASVFAGALVLCGYAYSGWNAAAYVAGEIRDPGRALPRALVVGTATVLVLYLAVNVVFFYAAAPAALAGTIDVGHVAAARLFGPGAAKVLSLLIVAGLVSSVSAMLMAGPRVYEAMAKDGLFFAALARRTRRGAPAAAVALQGGLALIIAATATFERLIYTIGFTLSLSAALTVLGAVVLRVREPAAPRPYRALGWPVTPALFIAFALWMAVASVAERPEESAAGGAVVAAGVIAYWFQRRRRRYIRPS